MSTRLLRALRLPALRLPALSIPALSCLALSAGLAAQNRGFLLTTSQTESTVSTSGGTVLQTLRPNEVSAVEFAPCPVVSAEKWAPITCYNTMAGDDDLDGTFYRANMFGSIDALLDVVSPIACSSQRSVFWSPSAALGTNISGVPGMRPGDTARIVRTGAGDGQVEYFLRAEDVQLALGMPISPIVVDVDAIAADPGYGVFFSLDQTATGSNACGPVTVLDGDVLMIPASAITWTSDLRVASVLPGSAHVLYTEAQMDAFVVAAGITDRFGVCVNQILDLEALEIDYAGAVVTVVPCPGVFLTAPALIFTGETLTGGGVLTTDAGGQIYNAGCGPLGSSCGTPLPTLGIQIGLRPPSGTLGIPSWVNALAATFVQRFVIEPKQHVLSAPTTVTIDCYSPSPLNWVFVKIGPPVIAPSVSFFNCYFPDAYVIPWIWWANPGLGFQTFTTPTISIPVKLVWQGAAIHNNQLILSTPATVDIN